MKRSPLMPAIVAFGALLGSIASAQTGHERRLEVELKGKQIMPFSQDRTVHNFRTTTTGGVQRVVAHFGDRTQVALVRQHVRKEATAFARGDMSDPAAIHGEHMPGLAAMHAGARHIEVRYYDLPDGAAITYATQRPELVAAIHAWFKAQKADHGTHAGMKM